MDNKISFFRFTNDKAVRNEWILRCYRKDKWNSEIKRIYSKHFQEGDYEDAMQATILNTYPRILKINNETIELI